MKKYLFLFVIGIILGLISCKTNCPEFDKEILSWIPYQENDVIELYSQSNNSTILFSITSVNIEHKTHYKHGTDCGGCSDYILINNYDSDFHLDMYIHENIIGSQSYMIIDTYFDTYSERKNYQFENKEYDLVRIFETNVSQGTFRKLIVAKEIGIIGLVDIHGNSWILRTNATIKKPNIQILRTSC